MDTILENGEKKSDSIFLQDHVTFGKYEESNNCEAPIGQ